MSEVPLNFRVEGRGEPLLLVHGFGISFNIWAELAPLLCPCFTLVMVELPGVGATPMPADGRNYLQACIEAIRGVRQLLGIEKWTVLGYSSGSRIAEAYVQADAEHVYRAIFLCPVMVGRHKREAVQKGIWLDRCIPAFGTWLLSRWRLRLLISWLGFNLKPDPRRDEWYAEIGAVPVAAMKETIRALAGAAAESFCVPVPYTMIWGDRDLVPLTPRTPGEHDCFVHGRHAAPVESAHEIARIVLSFRRST